METVEWHVREKIVIFFTIIVLSCIKADILYTKDDPLTLLDNTNFKKELFKQKNAWFVEFYNSWCGTCIRFAPSWKELANQVEDWSPAIKIAAIDCSVEANVKICNSQIGDEGYPTLKFFPPNYSAENQRNTIYTNIYKGDHNISKVKEGIIDYLQTSSNLYSTTDVTLSFTPLKALEDIWNELTSSVKHTVVIFENDKSYIGRETILDLIKYKSVLIRRVLKDGSNRYGVTVYPSMYLIDKGGTFKELASGVNQKKYKEILCDVVGIDLNVDKSIEGGGDLPEEEKKSTSHVHDSPTVIHMVDLESTLQYSLRREVASHGQIHGETLKYLTDYIYILAKYFPGQPHIKKYLWSVYNFIVKQKNSLSGTEWLTSIDALTSSSSYLPRNIKWACCQGSSARYRGYPCGVWSMFHVLTVSSAELKKKYSDYHEREVLSAMKGYVTTFVGCKECGNNFKKEVAGFEKKITTSDDSIMYLWQVHNSVNKRLHGDVTEDPQHVKVQFPTSAMCPKCRLPHNSSRWNEKEVLNFLKHVYSAKSIIQDSVTSKSVLNNVKTQKETIVNIKDPAIRKHYENLRKEKQDKKLAESLNKMQNEVVPGLEMQRQIARSKMEMLQKEAIYEYSRSNHPLRSWGFNSLDISLCVVFYCSGAAIILALYFHFIVKRKMSLKKISSSIWS